MANKKQWRGKAILHVDINSFYSSCEEIKNPSLKGKPHAVIMTPQDSNNITKGAVTTDRDCTRIEKYHAGYVAIPADSLGRGAI